ncbi:Ff.00g054630.m01.CDS01 [Fusarium sp. VM40]|nr:Ff.00g054630.m01.CDS01 [Fusarium sp. VM40]
MFYESRDDEFFETDISRAERQYGHSLQTNTQSIHFVLYPANDNNITSPNMQVNLFKTFAIIAALSTVQSAPVESTEGSVTREQIDDTHINKAPVDDAVRSVLTFPTPPYNTFYRLSED